MVLLGRLEGKFEEKKIINEGQTEVNRWIHKQTHIQSYKLKTSTQTNLELHIIWNQRDVSLLPNVAHVVSPAAENGSIRHTYSDILHAQCAEIGTVHVVEKVDAEGVVIPSVRFWREKPC